MATATDRDRHLLQESRTRACVLALEGHPVQTCACPECCVIRAVVRLYGSLQ